jgi:hypothetical protein
MLRVPLVTTRLMVSLHEGTTSRYAGQPMTVENKWSSNSVVEATMLENVAMVSVQKKNPNIKLFYKLTKFGLTQNGHGPRVLRTIVGPTEEEVILSNRIINKVIVQ